MSFIVGYCIFITFSPMLWHLVTVWVNKVFYPHCILENEGEELSSFQYVVTSFLASAILLTFESWGLL